MEAVRDVVGGDTKRVEDMHSRTADRVADTEDVLVRVATRTLAEEARGVGGETLVPPTTTKVAEAASGGKGVVQQISKELHDVVREPARESAVLGQGKVLLLGSEQPAGELVLDEICESS